jgi:hypothetical protein
MFSTSGDTIQPLTTDVILANNAINGYDYTGQWTNTEAAIGNCHAQLLNQPNPIIVLITDGVPTACFKNNGSIYRTTSTTGTGCANSKTTQQAAENAATAAVTNGISIIPVAISSTQSTIDAVNDFARCVDQAVPADEPCEANQNISVGDYVDLSDIIEKLLGTITCNA